MKAKLIAIFCAIAAMGLTIPCDDLSPLIGFEFDEFRTGSYRELTSGFGDTGVVSIRSVSGNCFDIREVDQTIHNDVFGDRAFTVDEPMIVEFKGQDNWGIVAYYGSDTFDHDRHSSMMCYAYDDEGGPDIYIGGDIGQTTFGPEELIDELGSPDAGFQYMVYFPGRRPFLSYVPRPIDYCVFDPDGEDVFIGLIQADPATVTVKSRGRGR